jgi:hypothetical protein
MLLLLLPPSSMQQMKDVMEQIGQLTEAITSASAAVGECLTKGSNLPTAHPQVLNTHITRKTGRPGAVAS